MDTETADAENRLLITGKDQEVRSTRSSRWAVVFSATVGAGVMGTAALMWRHPTPTRTDVSLRHSTGLWSAGWRCHHFEFHRVQHDMAWCETSPQEGGFQFKPSSAAGAYCGGCSCCKQQIGPVDESENPQVPVEGGFRGPFVDMALEDHGDLPTETGPGVSEAECVQLCRADALCNSLDFQPSTGACIRSKEARDRSGDEDDFENFTGWNYYEREVLGSAPAPPPTFGAPPPPDGQCSPPGVDCSSSRCCDRRDYFCFTKKAGYASCKAMCQPGIDINEPVDQQEPWECANIGGPGPHAMNIPTALEARHANAGCFVEEGGKLLIVKHSYGTWDIPGGTREGWESPQDTAVRETFEETGYRVRAGALRAVFEATGFHIYNCYVVDHNPNPNLDWGEINHMEWRPIWQLPEWGWRFPQEGKYFRQR